jgi:hypothetical protein
VLVSTSPAGTRLQRPPDRPTIRGVFPLRVSALLAISSLAALGGCSAIFSLDGYAAPSVDGGPSDGGARNDGGPRNPDASLDSEACPGFCDNFDDRSTPFLGDWTALWILNGGDASNAFITPDQFWSRPHSAEFHSPASSNGEKVGVLLTKDIALVDATLTLDFYVKLTGSAGDYAGYVNLVQISSGEEYVGGVTALPNGENADYEKYAEGGSVHSFGTLFGVDEDWHHVHYVAVYDTTENGSLHVTWDDQTLLDVTRVANYGAPPVPTSVRVSLGAAAQSPNPTIDVYIDNVVMQ